MAPPESGLAAGTAAAVREIAELVRQAGGRALLVGGCVRDKLLGREPKDFDLECFGVSGAVLRRILGERFDLDLVGLSFGVLKLHRLDIDVALPRRETKLGLGHRAFEMEHDPTLTVAEASARRDFTVNAIYEDPLTGEILDPWHGRDDLAKRILRHVSPHFREDPLRVLRGMQFVARFELTPAPETVAICREMTPEGLAPERLMGEWSKLLTQGVKISQGLAFLRAVGWVRYYPELERLIGCRQDPEWHPEGDVWNHTLCCLDAFARERDERRATAEGRAGEDLVVGLAVLCHDFGKPACTAYDPVRRRIRSLGHDEAGVAPTEAFLRRLTNEERLLREVPPLVRLHMRPFAMWKSRASDGAIRRLAAQVGRIDRLLRVAAADDAGRPPFPRDPEPLRWLAEQAERLRIADSAPKPLVQGRDLIALGMKPGPRFGEILKAAYEAQLDGAFFTLAQGIEFVKARGTER
ncbi:MAG: CCA tRNA nucleotidyltransferase [Kiritimatiellia bacterium]